MSNHEEKIEVFETRVKQTLNQSVDMLDPAIVAKLRIARERALQQSHGASRVNMFAWSIAGATTIVLLVILAISNLSTPGNDFMLQLSGDEQLLSAGEELEFYDELEFYSWLEETQQG